MKITCLSVRQPWATLIVYSSKFCENRTWRTDFTGELWIHASGWDQGYGPKPPETGPDAWRHPLPEGVILGRVDLRGCWEVDVLGDARGGMLPLDDEFETFRDAMNDLSQEPKNFYGWDHVNGPICWLLSDRVPLIKPIPMKGRLNLWTADVPEERLALPLWTPERVRVTA